MINVYFLPAWKQTSETILAFYKRQTPNCSGVWGNIRGVSDKKQADFFIAQDKEGRNDIIDIDRTIFIGREPKEIKGSFTDFSDIKNSTNKFHHHLGNTYLYVRWYVDKTYDQLLAQRSPEKSGNLVSINSRKKITQGHIDRLKFLLDYANQYSIDIFGTCSDLPEFSQKASGRLNTPSKQVLHWNSTNIYDCPKFNTLMKYKYALTFDNSINKNFFTSQFYDSLLSWCLPIHWGCPNLDEFFPDGSYIDLDIHNSDVLEKVKNISDSDLYYSNIENIAEARLLILNKYNLWPTLEEIIETGASTW